MTKGIVTVGQLKQALTFFGDDEKIRVLANKRELDAIDIKYMDGRAVICPARGARR